MTRPRPPSAQSSQINSVLNRDATADPISKHKHQNEKWNPTITPNMFQNGMQMPTQMMPQNVPVAPMMNAVPHPVWHPGTMFPMFPVPPQPMMNPFMLQQQMAYAKMMYMNAAQGLSRFKANQVPVAQNSSATMTEQVPSQHQNQNLQNSTVVNPSITKVPNHRHNQNLQNSAVLHPSIQKVPIQNLNQNLKNFDALKPSNNQKVAAAPEQLINYGKKSSLTPQTAEVLVQDSPNCNSEIQILQESTKAADNVPEELTWQQELAAKMAKLEKHFGGQPVNLRKRRRRKTTSQTPNPAPVRKQIFTLTEQEKLYLAKEGSEEAAVNKILAISRKEMEREAQENLVQIPAKNEKKPKSPPVAVRMQSYILTEQDMAFLAKARAEEAAVNKIRANSKIEMEKKGQEIFAKKPKSPPVPVRKQPFALTEQDIAFLAKKGAEEAAFNKALANPKIEKERQAQENLVQLPAKNGKNTNVSPEQNGRHDKNLTELQNIFFARQEAEKTAANIILVNSKPEMEKKVQVVSAQQTNVCPEVDYQNSELRKMLFGKEEAEKAAIKKIFANSKLEMEKEAQEILFRKTKKAATNKILAESRKEMKQRAEENFVKRQKYNETNSNFLPEVDLRQMFKMTEEQKIFYAKEKAEKAAVNKILANAKSEMEKEAQEIAAQKLIIMAEKTKPELFLEKQYMNVSQTPYVAPHLQIQVEAGSKILNIPSQVVPNQTHREGNQQQPNHTIRVAQPAEPRQISKISKIEEETVEDLVTLMLKLENRMGEVHLKIIQTPDQKVQGDLKQGFIWLGEQLSLTKREILWLAYKDEVDCATRAVKKYGINIQNVYVPEL